MDRIIEFYFSPTGHTAKVVRTLSTILQQAFPKAEVAEEDFTLPGARVKQPHFQAGDLVLAATPVIAGRVPNVLLPFLRDIKGEGAYAVPLVVYGNRNFDDALVELQDLLEAGGLHTIAGGAFIGEHSFSYTLGKNRPDEEDVKVIETFGEDLASRIQAGNLPKTVTLPGERPYRDYYKPQDRHGNHIDIRKVKPVTDDSCFNCKICVKACPMGAIDYRNVKKFNNICIKCNACVKKCPADAKHFDDPGYLYHKEELETLYGNRRAEPVVVIAP